MEEPLISIRFGPASNEGGQDTIFVEITNDGVVPIDSVYVQIVYDYAEPQDATEEFKKLHPNIPADKASIFQHMDDLIADEGDGALAIGESRTFFLPLAAVPDLRSYVESLPVEHFHVATTINGTTDKVIDGQELYELVQLAFPG